MLIVHIPGDQPNEFSLDFGGFDKEKSEIVVINDGERYILELMSVGKEKYDLSIFKDPDVVMINFKSYKPGFYEILSVVKKVDIGTEIVQINNVCSCPGCSCNSSGAAFSRKQRFF